jgi:hypothetical protein
MRTEIAWTILLMLLSNAITAQQISGSVINWESKSPIYQAKISNGIESTYTDTKGIFHLKHLNTQDTLLISKDGYSSKQVILHDGARTGQLLVFLLPLTHSLKEVRIQGTARYKMDSLRMRRDFADAFNYKRPTVMDIFVSNSTAARTGMFPDRNSNSTASIVTLNLLQLPSLFARNKNPNSKLKKALIQEEQNKFIDQTFSKSKISQLTGLQGDSLQLFIETYRPSATRLKDMSAYTLLLYIKESNVEFKSLSKKTQRLPPLK